MSINTTPINASTSTSTLISQIVERIINNEKKPILDKEVLNTTLRIRLLILEKLFEKNLSIEHIKKIFKYIKRNYITKHYIHYINFSKCSDNLIRGVVFVMVGNDHYRKGNICDNSDDHYRKGNICDNSDDHYRKGNICDNSFAEYEKNNSIIVEQDYEQAHLYITSAVNYITINDKDIKFVEHVMFLYADNNNLKILKAYLDTYKKLNKFDFLWIIVKYGVWGKQNKKIRDLLLDQIEIAHWNNYRVNRLYKRHLFNKNSELESYNLKRNEFIDVSMLEYAWSKIE